MALGKGKTLLVVDDEADIRELLVTELSAFGFETAEASNGTEAFQLILERRFDLVISDVRMSGGDGITLLRKVRERSSLSPRVILITGFADIEVPIAYDLGAEAVLGKPFSLREIVDAVEHLMVTERMPWVGQPPRIGPVKTRIEAVLGDCEEARAKGLFALGRGGVYLSEIPASARKGSLCSLKISFSSGKPELIAGQGLIRWIDSKESPGRRNTRSGWIEFVSLEPESEKAVLSTLERSMPRAYIPLP